MGLFDEREQLVCLPSNLVNLVVECAVRSAEMGKGIEEVAHIRTGIHNPACCEARYLRELRAGAEYLCREYGREIIMPEFRKVLGEERFGLYFGAN